MEFYGYKKCSTCRNAHRYLQEKGIELEFHDFVLTPPSKETLREWVSKHPEGVQALLNVRGTQFKTRALKPDSFTEEEWIEELSQDGKLLKRPVLVLDDEVVVGFDKGRYEEL